MPLRLTLELIPHGDESKKRTVGILDIENDGTGGEIHGNYDYKLQGLVEDGTLDELSRGRGNAKKIVRRGFWECALSVLGIALERNKWMTVKELLDQSEETKP